MEKDWTVRSSDIRGTAQKRCGMKETHMPHIWIADDDSPRLCVMVTTNKESGPDEPRTGD